MQVISLEPEELEAALGVLSRALESDMLPSPERAAIRSVLRKVGAKKEEETARARALLQTTEAASGHALLIDRTLRP